MEKYLRTLYKKFLKLDRKQFFIDSKRYSTSLKEMKLSDKILGEFYDSYYEESFLSFLRDIKTIIYSRTVFDFVKENFTDYWGMHSYLDFLIKEKIIKVNKNGKVSLLKKDVEKIIPRPQTSQEIKSIIEKKLKVKANEKDSIINLFKKFRKFTVKGKWDQMPISQSSAFFVVSKILKYLPKNGKFLFVGDDDFMSLVLSLAEPNIESLVIDADEEVLSIINELALKFNLKIKTRKVDLRKQKNLGEKFIGFLCNPIYTEVGTKKFVNFGKNQLGKDGGFAFLEVGDEAIGNRFLFLQDFFTKNNLIIRELIPNEVYYPNIALYKEDEEITKRLSSIIDKEVIKESPELGAALYVFEYLPKKPKKVKFKKPIYAYL
jgi:predicted methyltransferase